MCIYIYTLETKQNSVTNRSSKTRTSLKEAICQACVDDGLKHPDVLRLSKLGTNGAHAQNCLNEMDKCLKKPSLSKAVGQISVPVKVDENTNVMQEQSFLDPHAAFSVIYHDTPKAFLKRICGDDVSRIPQFWSDMVDHPSYAAHPILKSRPDHKEKAIPIDLFGDGVPLELLIDLVLLFHLPICTPQTQKRIPK